MLGVTRTAGNHLGFQWGQVVIQKGEVADTEMPLTVTVKVTVSEDSNTPELVSHIVFMAHHLSRASPSCSGGRHREAIYGEQ